MMRIFLAHTTKYNLKLEATLNFKNCM